MYPILIEYQGFTLPAWHFCYFLAAIVAFWLLLRLVRIHGDVSRRTAIDVYLISYVSGYFGARVLSLFIDGGSNGVLDFLRQIFFSLGSMTLYGGVITAVVLVALYIWRQQSVGWQLFDYVVIVFLLALAIGRIGCFLNGDDFGLATDSFFGVVFPNLGDEIKRHPTQLYESIFCLLLFFCCYYWRNQIRQRFFVGSVGLIGAGSYAFFRFLNEFLRGDYRGWVIDNELSTSQFISMLLLAGVCVCWRLKRS